MRFHLSSTGEHLWLSDAKRPVGFPGIVVFLGRYVQRKGVKSGFDRRFVLLDISS